jgi:hypothetical protein
MGHTTRRQSRYTINISATKDVPNALILIVKRHKVWALGNIDYFSYKGKQI